MGQPPREFTTLELNVGVLNAEHGRFRIAFDRYLQGPKEANALRVILPGGLLLQRPIMDGRNEPLGGWLLIAAEHYDLALEQPANLIVWKWERAWQTHWRR